MRPCAGVLLAHRGWRLLDRCVRQLPITIRSFPTTSVATPPHCIAKDGVTNNGMGAVHQQMDISSSPRPPFIDLPQSISPQHTRSSVRSHTLSRSLQSPPFQLLISRRRPRCSTDFQSLRRHTSAPHPESPPSTCSRFLPLPSSHLDMAGEQVTRRVYSAEQLYRLRVSCSQPKLREAIEDNDGEDAELVKEHVLRGSKSFAARSFRSRTSGNSLRVPSNKENYSTTDAENSTHSSAHASGHDFPIPGPVLGEIANNGQLYRRGVYSIRPSPTPSLKKKKAEAIVKAHGSPQHVRVTAGGRIVPSEQSPLCHPRYGYSAIKANGGLVKFAPNHPLGKTQWTQATQNGFIAEDANGVLCQIVNGTILPLNEIDGALRLYIPAPNLNISPRGTPFDPANPGSLGDNGDQKRTSSLSKTVNPADPPLATQTNALELEYSKHEHELRELDKTEVLHGRTMGKAARDALISKRRELILTLDNIRKAIKSIKSMPMMPEPATAPRLASHQRAMSTSRPRGPGFFPNRHMQSADAVEVPSVAPYGSFFGMVPPPQSFGAAYGYQTGPGNDANYNPSFAAPLFVPPPSLDGSIPPPFLSYQELAGMKAKEAAEAPKPAESDRAAHLSQTDGAGSIADIRKVTSPARSHAVDIKAPDAKSATMLKSNLNPMSPAYKPGNGVLQMLGNGSTSQSRSVVNRAPSISPAHQLKPATTATTKPSDETISPTKKSPHLHSSSVSSFETADFFPRNTREYSTRKYAYPETTQQSEDKENIGPEHSVPAAKDSPRFKIHDSRTGSSAMHASSEKSGIRVGQSSSQSSGPDFSVVSVPDRHAHNVSPKNRRQHHLSVTDGASELPSLPPSSPEKPQSSRSRQSVDKTQSNKIDFSDASIDWIQGFRAGFSRQAIDADRVGDFLDGYCAGLIKSKPAKHLDSTATGSPVKSDTCRPSPAVLQSSSRVQQESLPALSPFESNLHSMDTLKEAIISPANENPLLSPAVDGPHANEPPFNLGAWAKRQDRVAAAEVLSRTSGDGLAGFPFPHRTASVAERQGIMSESNVLHNPHVRRAEIMSEGVFAGPSDGVPRLVPTAMPGQQTQPNNRIASITSLDSHLYSAWPGARVFSNQLEWKSASSVAQAAGLTASGHFSTSNHHEGKAFDTPSFKKALYILAMLTALPFLHRSSSSLHHERQSYHAEPQPVQRGISGWYHEPPQLPSATPRVRLRFSDDLFDSASSQDDG
ncbi:hypothetical protein BDY17DRAFT_136638 [Neohortaea acidophila]|uniref:Uncharacterized protein n=1 Tax=Neohortaea acidophila TaxID=245834 RepID=A0A6A6PT68_9PEZI|nr:uncharacterized protein BDY17DRAFT_136638 [Neohortaea acidophila]KAF2482871.1 hypothetical protein BDY17DRAFT_136638 [Neohortaea acidophila]